MSESERGCGYRKIGGLYLCCDGVAVVCDGLPMELEPCECCGFMPPFSRNLQRISPKYIAQAERNHHIALRAKGSGDCSCGIGCPICVPDMGKPYGLMFVGKKYYTPREFIREAENMGISKRIPDIPSWLILGETWILLAHDEVPKISLEKLKANGLLEKEPEKFRAVFYAFKPQRIEMPLFKGEVSEDELMLLRKKGITPVLLDPTPENKKKHGKAQNTKILKKLLQEILEADEEAED